MWNKSWHGTNPWEEKHTECLIESVSRYEDQLACLNYSLARMEQMVESTSTRGVADKLENEETVEEGGRAACEGWITLPEEFLFESIRSFRERQY